MAARRRPGYADDLVRAVGRRTALGLLGGIVSLAAGCDDRSPLGASVALGPKPPANVRPFELAILATAVPVVVGTPLANAALYAYRADLEMSSLDVEKIAEERALIELVELYAVLNAGEGRPFTKLSLPGQNAWLDELRTSSNLEWRGAYQVVHALLLSSFYSDPDAWPAIGYAGPPAVGQVLDDSMAGAS